MDLRKYLKQMCETNASDLYLKPYSPVYLRVDGKLRAVEKTPLSPDDTESVMREVLSESQQKDFDETLEMDAALAIEDVGRFRVNVYRQMGTVALVFRLIESVIPSFEELNLPAKLLEEWSLEERGLILVTGIAGSGKSTTIAAMIDYINNHDRKHIITIEDPIEFAFHDKQSVISQREVGADTHDFHNALRHVIRQSPDVIFIGEMRDLETIQNAIMAAETGHLVLSTLHTVDATQTVERIINFFPPHQHNQVRMQLSLILKGVISLRLLLKKDGAGRMPACEVMVITPTIRKVIREGRTNDLYDLIKRGDIAQMQTFNQAIVKLFKEGKITENEGVKYSSNVEELTLELRGIYSGSDTFKTKQ